MLRGRMKMDLSLLLLTVISLGWYRLILGSLGADMNMMTTRRMMTTEIALSVLRLVELSFIYSVSTFFYKVR